MEKSHSSIPELDSLLAKYTELLTGEVTEERVEKVKIWALYNHMLKTMPPLVKHWSSEPQHQEAKKQIREIFEDIQRWNEENKRQLGEKPAE